MTYIKENIITKLQKLYKPPRKPRTGNKLSALFVRKSFCNSDFYRLHTKYSLKGLKNKKRNKKPFKNCSYSLVFLMNIF